LGLGSLRMRCARSDKRGQPHTSTNERLVGFGGQELTFRMPYAVQLHGSAWPPLVLFVLSVCTVPKNFTTFSSKKRLYKSSIASQTVHTDPQLQETWRPQLLTTTRKPTRSLKVLVKDATRATAPFTPFGAHACACVCFLCDQKEPKDREPDNMWASHGRVPSCIRPRAVALTSLQITLFLFLPCLHSCRVGARIAFRSLTLRVVEDSATARCVASKLACAS
jgi:hypothetical protein